MGSKYENLLESGSGNIVQSFYDSFLKSNADFRSKAGFKMTVIRESIGVCCAWCQDLVGTYDYDNRPADIYARHKNCTCIVTTRTERGTYQDAWSRAEYDSQRDARIARADEIADEIEKDKKASEDRKKLAEQIRQELFVEKNVKNDIIIMSGEARRFNTFFDPMVEVTGPAEISNPEQIKQFIEEINEAGCELIRRNYEDLGYAPGAFPGIPGQLHISEGSSYSAWVHEMQHMRDDKAAGWSGYRIMQDVDEVYRREQRAYNLEIQLAKEAGRPDIIKRLQDNLETEKAKIYGRHATTD